MKIRTSAFIIVVAMLAMTGAVVASAYIANGNSSDIQSDINEDSLFTVENNNTDSTAIYGYMWDGKSTFSENCFSNLVPRVLSLGWSPAYGPVALEWYDSLTSASDWSGLGFIAVTDGLSETIIYRTLVPLIQPLMMHVIGYDCNNGGQFCLPAEDVGFGKDASDFAGFGVSFPIMIETFIPEYFSCQYDSVSAIDIVRGSSCNDATTYLDPRAEVIFPIVAKNYLDIVIIGAVIEDFNVEDYDNGIMGRTLYDKRCIIGYSINDGDRELGMGMYTDEDRSAEPYLNLGRSIDTTKIVIEGNTAGKFQLYACLEELFPGLEPNIDSLFLRPIVLNQIDGYEVVDFNLGGITNTLFASRCDSDNSSLYYDIFSAMQCTWDFVTGSAITPYIITVPESNALGFGAPFYGIGWNYSNVDSDDIAFARMHGDCGTYVILEDYMHGTGIPVWNGCNDLLGYIEVFTSGACDKLVVDGIDFLAPSFIPYTAPFGWFWMT